MQAIMFVVGLVLLTSVPLLLMSRDLMTDATWQKRYRCTVHGWAVYKCRKTYETYQPGEDPRDFYPFFVTDRISTAVMWINDYTGEEKMKTDWTKKEDKTITDLCVRGYDAYQIAKMTGNTLLDTENRIITLEKEKQEGKSLHKRIRCL